MSITTPLTQSVVSPQPCVRSCVGQGLGKSPARPPRASVPDTAGANATKKGGKGVDPIQKSLINVRAQLQKAEEKISELEESLQEAEEAAR